MENKTPSTNDNLPNQGKKQPIALIVLLVVLLIAASILIYVYVDLRKDSAQQEIEYVQLQKSKDSLNIEFNVLYQDFDSLKTENDSMNVLIETHQEQIMKMIKNNKYDRYRISQYKNELKTLREIMRSFVVQLDSLNTLNLELTAENIEIKSQLEQTVSEREKLKQEKEDLNSKVKMASVLTAKEIEAVCLNKSSKERNRAKIIEKVRTCFTLRENPIVPAGSKEIFLRIYRPDGFLMTPSAENIFESTEGSLIFSAKREVMYENKDVPMCIYYDKTEEFVEGDYKVELYADKHLIGETSFALK